MKNWWADTLFKRLFLLMWVALVVSHLCAFYAVKHFYFGGGPPGMGAGGLPVLPSLPPGGLLPDMRPDMRPPQDGSAPPPPPPGAGEPRPHAPGLSASALWLDYGVRFLVIGIAAWFGARWLSGPMRKLADASDGLSRALAGRQPAPPLDEASGTLEVRRTAQVFNTMAQGLRAQFEARSLLMAAMSHDLRTPLTRLRLRLEQAQDGPLAQRCVADVHEMDQLIGGVLDLVRNEHTVAARDRLDVSALVQARCDDLADEGAAVALAVPAQPDAWQTPTSTPTAQGTLVVLARADALNRVLDNLIGNALRHAGSARVAVSRCGTHAEITIDDDGPGIPPPLLEAVFQPFFRAGAGAVAGGTARASGSGLGLYIARDLVEREGGQLSLANRSGGGLRVTLRLPLA